ncbi:MAG: gamma-glutamyltransferase family protein [Pseudomonadota bacterium]
MLNTPRALRGMMTAPHHLAAEAGLRVLREGGNAIEAMIAAAATAAAVYPHMNSIGGDGFWLVAEPGRAPLAIDACGAAGAAVGAELYRRHGLAEIPARGPLAANTVAGTVAGWGVALEVARAWGGMLPLARLLEDAIHYARDGVPVTASQASFTGLKRDECREVPGFAATFLENGAVPAVGSTFKQPALARTLARIAASGTEDYYRGELARAIAAGLARAGSPLAAGDLAGTHARQVEPLSLKVKCGVLYNLPPPTQGLASLLILGLFDGLDVAAADSFPFVHGIVEATKLAFRVRDRHLGDPAYMASPAAELLAPARILALARQFDAARAAPWPAPADAGDTVWMGCIDGVGRAASFIQSLYWEFGSAVVLADTGILWQNRGASFRLDPGAPNELKPARQPFHTLNPALARLSDGRTMVYGAMGGDGQPQTQAQIFSRVAMFGAEPQAAVSAPRWLLGRTWGTATTRLRIESRLDPGVVRRLAEAGHDLEVVAPFSDLMGHAGMVVRGPAGLLEGAADPRGDGAAVGF